MAGAAGCRWLARVSAWALLTGGWIVLAHASDRLAPGPWHHAALLVAWLLALAGAAALVRRVPLPAAGRSLIALACAVLAARSLGGALDGAGWWALWPALPAWAGLVAMASGPCRVNEETGRAPLVAAAAGALLAWAVLGDPTDLHALLPRAALLLAGGVVLLVAATLSAPTSPAGPGRPGLDACPAPAVAGGSPAAAPPWPLRLAALAMLPMMAGLPQMLALCRSDAASPSVLLGLHLAAMFLPGLCLPRLAPGTAAGLCLLLLAAGGAAAALPPGAGGMGLALAFGAAWSLAWASRVEARCATRLGCADRASPHARQPRTTCARARSPLRPRT